MTKGSAAILLTFVALVGCGADDGDRGEPADSGARSEGASTSDASSAGVEADAADAGIECTVAPDAASYDPGAIDAGRAIVEAFGCHGCHTGDLSGSTTPIGLGVFAKNLTPDPVNGLGCWTDEQIARAVLSGVDDEGEHLCVMPRFDRDIDDAGAASLVAYLRSLPAVDHVIPESSCPPDPGDW